MLLAGYATVAWLDADVPMTPTYNLPFPVCRQRFDADMPPFKRAAFHGCLPLLCTVHAAARFWIHRHTHRAHAALPQRAFLRLLPTYPPCPFQDLPHLIPTHPPLLPSLPGLRCPAFSRLFLLLPWLFHYALAWRLPFTSSAG